MVTQGQFILFKTKEKLYEWLMNVIVQRSVYRVQNHHTEIPSYKDFNGNNHYDKQLAMQIYHTGVQGWSDIAQHFTTFPDGSVMTGRSLDRNPAGIYNNNKGSICIEHFGNFDKDNMTPEQRDMIIFLNAVLSIKFKIEPSINTMMYHRWYNGETGKFEPNGTGKAFKTCPGTNFFGGNTVNAAKKHFIPLVKQRMGEIDMEFKDLITNGNRHWAADIIEKAAEEGIVKGIKQHDGSYIFKPNDPITRAEATVLIMRAIGKA